MSDALHLTSQELERGFEHIRQSPADFGVLEMIVCRMGTGERKVLTEAVLDGVKGLLGDSWHQRGSSKRPDGSAHPDMQITIMNSRCIALLAKDKTRWPLAGDQLFVDLNLSTTNLPTGTRLAIGSAILEVSPLPHTGCAKFLSRFGQDAVKFVNSPRGRELNLRGINARIIQGGTIQVGQSATKAAAKLV